jgi:transposase
MRRTEALQGVRKNKFLDILGRCEAAEFSQVEAAELLGVGERTFRRWRQRFEDAGEAGLLDRRLGKASGKRVPADREAQVEALYRSRYAGFTAKHFHEHLLRDHQFVWGYTWTKTFLHSKGLLERAERRGAHRRKRPRRPMLGMMLHQPFAELRRFASPSSRHRRLSRRRRTHRQLPPRRERARLHCRRRSQSRHQSSRPHQLRRPGPAIRARAMVPDHERGALGGIRAGVTTTADRKWLLDSYAVRPVF